MGCIRYGNRSKGRVIKDWRNDLRACSRLGEHEYDLIFNNCEHFAIWCRTNVAESKQTKRVEDAMQGVLDYLDELNARLE